MTGTTPAEFLSRLVTLEQMQRVLMLEALAFNLTIAVRSAWSDSSLTTQEQLDALKTLNECQHRVVARLQSERRHASHWTEESFVAMLGAHDLALPSSVRGCIFGALETALRQIENGRPAGRQGARPRGAGS